jgi:magnesium-transporting ATPase (P-type)
VRHRERTGLRLIEAVNLRIEESALTGESAPAEKSSAPVPADAGIGDRHGMAYSGTMIAAGEMSRNKSNGFVSPPRRH